MNLEKVLKLIYDREINVRIQSHWDAGWYVYFQDPLTHKWCRKNWCSSTDDLKDILEREVQRHDRYEKTHRKQRDANTGNT